LNHRRYRQIQKRDDRSSRITICGKFVPVEEPDPDPVEEPEPVEEPDPDPVEEPDTV
jgi:hypothetical protein